MMDTSAKMVLAKIYELVFASCSIVGPAVRWNAIKLHSVKRQVRDR